MTPGAPSPGGYNPHTPGSNIDQSSNDWVTTDIMVRVKDTFLDGGVINQTGVIRSVTVSSCGVLSFSFKNVLQCKLIWQFITSLPLPSSRVYTKLCFISKLLKLQYQASDVSACTNAWGWI